MEDKLIKRIRTPDGDLRIDYNALANLPKDMSSIPLYLTFAGNVNSDMLDAAFGKNNEDEIIGLGKALVMYSKFKGETLSFEALSNCKNLSDIENSEEALAEIKNSSLITSLIEASPYAYSYLNNVKKALNKLLPTEYQRDSVAEMLADTEVMGYMYDNYETFEASGILSSDEFISIATTQAIRFYDGSDMAATTETNGLHKKVLLISMTLSVNTANVYPWTFIDNKTKAVGYRPDGTTYLVQRQSVSSTASSCDCTSFVKGKFASKVVQLPYGVSATVNEGYATQYNTVYYIPCE